jgi:hypothetical protein
MFKLHIECTKDIDSLSINFSDGTSIITPSQDSANTSVDDIEVPLHFDNHKPKEIIKAIKVPEVSNRPPKIDDNLDNREF